MSTADQILFAIVAFLLFVGLNFYIWARVVRAPAMPAPWSKVLTVGLVVMAVAMLAGSFAARRLGWDLGAAQWLVWLWMGFVLFLVIALFGTDLVRWAAAAWTRGTGNPGVPTDPERRLFFSRLAAGGATLASVSMLSTGVGTALCGPLVRRLRVVLPRLPKGLSGTRLVQITDLHVGQVLGRPYVENVVRRTNELAPDLIVITGDLVDGSPRRLRQAVAPLAELKARLGVFFVSGNHDYYAGFEPWVPVLQDLGMRVLRNERVTIGNDDEGFDLAGIEDPVGRMTGHGPDLEHALAGRDNRRELVLLAHRPRAVFAAREHGVGLQLSGHTHGGQIWPFTWIAHLVFPVAHGFAWFGDTQLYVSRGTGYVGIPVRLGAPAELTHIELVSARSDGVELALARHAPPSWVARAAKSAGLCGVS